MSAPTLIGIALAEPKGEGWTQLLEIVFAFVLSSVIGLERELAQKNAGLRTLSLVGVGSALFMLVSKYGFTDVLQRGTVVLDPSRVAAQIVTGIGFIGGGLIFVRRDDVRGLTTAAVVWVTAAVGAACGAGLPMLAAIATVCHFIVVQGYPRLLGRFGLRRSSATSMDVYYFDGRGLLRTILAKATGQGYVVSQVETHGDAEVPKHVEGAPSPTSERVVGVSLQIEGPRALQGLIAAIQEVDGVVLVTSGTSVDAMD